MTLDALILHGKPLRERYENTDLPKPHEANWLPWLQLELAKRCLSSAIPKLPKPYYPEFEPWKSEVEQYEIDEDTTVVTHSASSEFILRYLSGEPDISLRQLLMVAPWTDVSGKYGDFSRYTLDESLPSRVGRIVILNSLDDSGAIQDNVRKLISTLNPIDYVEFEDYGHFMLGNNMTDQAFPELLNEIDAISS